MTNHIGASTQRRKDAEAQKARRKNPEGISFFSPGLRSYPGLATQNQSNPNGVLAGVNCMGTQPRWGCDPLDSDTQGSSSLATLGWRPESLWDSTNRIHTSRRRSPRGRNLMKQPPGRQIPAKLFSWIPGFRFPDSIPSRKAVLAKNRWERATRLEH